MCTSRSFPQLLLRSSVYGLTLHAYSKKGRKDFAIRRHDRSVYTQQQPQLAPEAAIRQIALWGFTSPICILLNLTQLSAQEPF